MALATVADGTIEESKFGIAELPAEWFGGAGAGDAYDGTASLRLGECVFIEDSTLTGNTALCSAWPNKMSRMRKETTSNISRAISKTVDNPNPWNKHNVKVTSLTQSGKRMVSCTSVTLESQSGLNTTNQNDLINSLGRYQTGQTLNILSNRLFFEKGLSITTPQLGCFLITALLPSGSDVYQMTEKTSFHINIKKPIKPMMRHVDCPFPGLSVVWEIIYSIMSSPSRYNLLLHGPSGVGKSFVVSKFAEEFKLPITVVSCSQKDSLEKISEKSSLNGIILLEDVEVKGTSELIKKITALAKDSNAVIISTSTSASKIAAAVRNASVLGLEILMTPPDEYIRSKIFQYYLPSSSPDECIESASLTRGCTGKDISRICESKSSSETELKELCLSYKSELHRATCTELLTPISFNEIGGLDEVKKAVSQAVMWPVNNKEMASNFKVQAPSGILLFGPPGCAKTTIARAVAHESNRPLFSVDAAGLFACYVGESESILRAAFAKAALVAPSILFIDELESICGSKRSDRTDDTASKLLTTLLTELDGVTSKADILFMAATNYPEVLDPAVIRPGRLDMIIHVPPPNSCERLSILNLLTSSITLSDNDILTTLSSNEHTHNYTGADLKAVVTEAKLSAVRRILKNGGGEEFLKREDFDNALSVVQPSLNENITSRYELFEKQMG